MKKYLVVTLLSALFLAACQPALITAVKWDSSINNSNVQTRCERVDLRDKADMDNLFVKYDGWKLIYLSEYTTSNKTGTDAAVCFERAK